MSGDVTAGYIMLDVERLRKPMEIITDYILRQMKVKDSCPTPLHSTVKSRAAYPN